MIRPYVCSLIVGIRTQIKVFCFKYQPQKTIAPSQFIPKLLKILWLVIRNKDIISMCCIFWGFNFPSRRILLFNCAVLSFDDYFMKGTDLLLPDRLCQPSRSNCGMWQGRGHTHTHPHTCRNPWRNPHFNVKYYE